MNKNLLKFKHLPPKSNKQKISQMPSRDYTPLSWEHYFDNCENIRVNVHTFRVYKSGSSGPVCIFLHGGGYSALTWALLSKTLTGFVHCQCIAIDLRGHGDTVCDEDDMSAESITNDVERVIQEMFKSEPSQGFILIGHSMGGSIAVRVARSIPSVIGLIVMDVVEGTAIDSLSAMKSVLQNRPTKFDSLERAIEWSIRSGQTRNREAARVSMVGQVKRVQAFSSLETSAQDLTFTNSNAIAEETCSSSSTPIQSQSIPSHPAEPPFINTEESMCEEAGSDNTQSTSHSPCLESSVSSDKFLYTWRVDLSKTSKYWRGWFEGLSSMFLSCPVPKLLLLAGIDRLDKELMVGQMQGKFQLQVLHKCGHAVQEDDPDKVADIIAQFMLRNKWTTATENFHSPFS